MLELLLIDESILCYVDHVPKCAMLQQFLQQFLPYGHHQHMQRLVGFHLWPLNVAAEK